MTNAKTKNAGRTDKRTVPTVAAPPIRIFTDGAGARPDGTGSGFAWIREDMAEKQVHKQDGLTNNEAEYLALRSALQALPGGTSAAVLTDSQLICCQFNGQYKVTNSKLAALLAEIRELIINQDLTVEVSWVPRQQNLAGKLI